MLREEVRAFQLLQPLQAEKHQRKVLAAFEWCQGVFEGEDARDNQVGQVRGHAGLGVARTRVQRFQQSFESLLTNPEQKSYSVTKKKEHKEPGGGKGAIPQWRHFRPPRRHRSGKRPARWFSPDWPRHVPCPFSTSIPGDLVWSYRNKNYIFF